MNSRKVLIVEDELLVALVYQHYLEKRGFSILGPFTSGAETLEVLPSISFDVALLDIQLDDNITGIEIAKIIRSRCDVPIIFMTGNEMKSTKSQTNNIPNSYILSKPIDFNELTTILG